MDGVDRNDLHRESGVNHHRISPHRDMNVRSRTNPVWSEVVGSQQPCRAGRMRFQVGCPVPAGQGEAGHRLNPSVCLRTKVVRDFATVFVLSCWCAIVAVAESPEPSPSQPGLILLPPPGAETSKLQNLIQISDRIFSGGEPKGERAFAELVRLGVRTIVSVDGLRPDVDAAHAQGLRYVHIPIGYDGIPADAGKSLARLVRDVDGRIYIHCHHGKHRGPAAAAIACVAAGTADGPAALQILKHAGTSREYIGLWNDVANFRPPAADERLPELKEVAQVESLPEAMARIDRAADQLTSFHEVGWQVRPSDPDVSASQVAVLLEEGFRESVRTLTGGDEGQLHRQLSESSQTAARLRDALQRRNFTRASRIFEGIQRRCQACHKAYRN